MHRFVDEILKRDRRTQKKRNLEARARLGILDPAEELTAFGTHGSHGNGIRRAKNALAGYFLGAKARVYGFFLLIFGLMTLLLHFADYYIKTEVIDVLYPLLCGALCSIVSIPLLIPDTPIHKATEDDPIVSFVLYDFFCFRHYQEKGGAILRKRVAIPLAILLSVVGFFTSPWYVILAIAGLVFLPLALSTPEFPFLLSLALLPYFSLLPHSAILLGSLVALAMLSYLRKVVLGNRTFAIRSYDILLIIFSLFFLISGIFNGGMSSFTSALLLAILTSGYTLATGLIVNRRIADSATSALGLLSFPVSIYSIYQYFFTTPSDIWSDAVFADAIRTRVTGTFQNPNVLAMFLLVASIFALYHLRATKKTGGKIVCGIVLILHLFALALTFSRGAYIALGLTFIALIVLRYAKKPGLLLTGLAILPHLLFFLPSSIIERLLSVFNLADSSIAYRLSIARSSIAMFLDRIFLGVGVGEETFREAFFAYAEEGVIAPHSHNLLLQIGCEAGIFALICFILLLVLRAREATVSVPLIRKSTVRLSSVYSLATLFALILFGFSDDIFSTFPIFYLFWIVFGIGSAVLLVAKREMEDRANYYGDEQSPESSIVDIRLH